MSTILRAAAFAVLACAAFGCEKPSAPAPVETHSSPWSSASNFVEVARFGVNQPRPDGRACWTATYSVSFANRTLHVETCSSDDPMSRDVALGDAELQKIQAALVALRESHATQCDADKPAFIVQIHDAPRTLAQYTDSSNACHAGDMGTIDHAGLEALFATIATIESARS